MGLITNLETNTDYERRHAALKRTAPRCETERPFRVGPVVLEPDLVESRGTAKLALAFNPAIAVLFRLTQLGVWELSFACWMAASALNAA
jgi:hypothetical protein